MYLDNIVVFFKKASWTTWRTGKGYWNCCEMQSPPVTEVFLFLHKDQLPCSYYPHRTIGSIWGDNSSRTRAKGPSDSDGAEIFLGLLQHISTICSELLKGGSTVEEEGTKGQAQLVHVSYICQKRCSWNLEKSADKPAGISALKRNVRIYYLYKCIWFTS